MATTIYQVLVLSTEQMQRMCFASYLATNYMWDIQSINIVK